MQMQLVIEDLNTIQQSYQQDISIDQTSLMVHHMREHSDGRLCHQIRKKALRNLGGASHRRDKMLRLYHDPGNSKAGC